MLYIGITCQYAYLDVIACIINREPKNEYDGTRPVPAVYEAIHPLESDHNPVTKDNNPACQSTVLVNKANVVSDENEYEIALFQPTSSNNGVEMETNPAYAETQFK